MDNQAESQQDAELMQSSRMGHFIDGHKKTRKTLILRVLNVEAEVGIEPA